LQGLEVNVHMKRAAPTAGPRGNLKIEPLGHANGRLVVRSDLISSVPDWMKTDVLSLEVIDGKIDLTKSNFLPIKDTDPESRIGRIREWLREQTEIGLLPDIELEPLVEKKLNAPDVAASGPATYGYLNSIGLRDSDLTLGPGRIGTPRYGITL